MTSYRGRLQAITMPTRIARQNNKYVKLYPVQKPVQNCFLTNLLALHMVFNIRPVTTKHNILNYEVNTKSCELVF